MRMTGAGIEPATFRCSVGSDCGTSLFILLRPRKRSPQAEPASGASKRRCASGCRCWRHGQPWQPNLVPANQLPMSPPPRPDPNLCWDRSPTWVAAAIPRARPGKFESLSMTRALADVRHRHGTRPDQSRCSGATRSHQLMDSPSVAIRSRTSAMMSVCVPPPPDQQNFHSSRAAR